MAATSGRLCSVVKSVAVAGAWEGLLSSLADLRRRGVTVTEESPWDRIKWAAIHSFVLALYVQSSRGHFSLFAPVCIVSCDLWFDFEAKRLPQNLHEYGLSPV